jgi:hypothetical protein
MRGDSKANSSDELEQKNDGFHPLKITPMSIAIVATRHAFIFAS